MTTPILSQVEPPPWEDYKKTVETPGVIADVVSPLPATQTERPPWEDYAAAPVTPVVAEPQQVEPEPWKDYKTTQSRIAPSTIAGDIERTAGSAFSGLVLSGLNAVKGIADLNAKIPLPQFVRNLKEQTGSTALEGQMRQKVDSMIEEWGQYREQVQSEIRAEGGLPAIVMQNIGDSTLNTAVMLTAMGSGGYTGVWRATKEIAKVTLTESMKLAVKEAIKFGGLMAATTHGDAKARTIAGAHAAAMMLLPIPASKLPTDWMAKSANILGLNVLSAIVGDFSIQTAKDKAVANGTPDEWAKEWFAEGVPPFVINAMFGIMAKSAKRGNPDAKILTENIPEEIKPLIEGTKQLAETKPDLPPSTSPQPQTTAKAAEAPAGAFVPQEVKGGGDISEKPVVESEVKLKPEHEDPLIEAKKRKDNGASQEEVNRVALNAADGYRETNVDEMMRKQEELGRPITKEEAEVFAKKNKAYNKLIEDRLVELGVIKKPASAAPPPSSGKAAELMTPEPVRVNPAKLTREVKSDSGYVYHATSADRLDEIISSGKLIPHKPDYGTDQSAWPDRSTEKRSYFSRKADVVWQFSPEEGDPVVIRTKDTPELRTESTGDVYSRGSIKAENLEYLGDDGNWHSLVFKPTPPAEVAQGKMGAEVTPAKIAEVKTKMDKGRKELGVSMSEQKTYLLAEIDKAIADLPLDGVGAGTVKIQVPGDGTFTITQGKENLENFRKAVKSRFPSKPSEQDKPGGSITKLSQDQSADEAMKLYGDAGKAADVLERQSKNPEYTEDQRKGFDSLVSELRDRANITSVPEHQMSDRIKEIRAKVEARAYDLEQSKAMQDAKVREQKGLDAVKKHPRYAELQKALQEKEVELPKDGDLLNVKVEGRGAPAIRDLQDAIGKDIGVPRGKPVFKGDIGSFVLERYWKDVAQEYMPEEPSTQEQAAPKGGEVKPATEQSFNSAMNAGTKTINPNTGKLYTEHDLRTSLEVAGIVDPGKARYDAMSSEQRIEAVNHLNALFQERKPLGADAANRLGILTTLGTEPGRERIKSLLQTTIESEKTLPDTKAELGKRDPLYEQQRSKQLKDVVLGEFTKDPSLISEAEAFMRDPKEPMDTKGVIGVALFEHYRNTGNNAAQLALFDLVDPLSLGAGRFSQAWSMLNALTGKNWITTMDRYLTRRNVKLPEDIHTEIETSFAEAAKIKDPDAHTQAIHAIISKINTYVPFKAGTWWDAYRYTNMLFNPQSHERNIYGNNVQAFVTRPLVLIARGNFSGAHAYITKAWQDVMNGNALRVAKESFNSDYSKFAEYLNTPNTSVFERIQMEDGPVGAKQRLAWKALNFIPKLLNAQDKFFGSLIEAGETARLLEDGMSPANAQSNAHILAETMLYRERLGGSVDASLPAFSRALDRAADLMEKARTSDQPLISWPSKLFIPFLRTPIRIAQFSVEASPLAYLGPKMNVENIARAKYGKSFDKLNTSDQLAVKEILEFRKGLAAVGTVITLMGVGAAMTGNTTWSAPQDPDAKKYFYASGRRPYSFRVGNRWIPMMYLGPFFLAYALPAAARDAFADNPASVDSSMISRLALAASGIPRIILSQTPMSGMASLIDAVQGKIDKTVGAAIGFTGSQFIPASGLLRWFDKIVDPTYRRPVTVMETIKAGIPGLSDDLKAYLDANGKDAERTWTDIYLPYTIGANDKRNEQYLKVRNEQIRAEIAVREMQRR